MTSCSPREVGALVANGARSNNNRWRKSAGSGCRDEIRSTNRVNEEQVEVRCSNLQASVDPVAVGTPTASHEVISDDPQPRDDSSPPQHNVDEHFRRVGASLDASVDACSVGHEGQMQTQKRSPSPKVSLELEEHPYHGQALANVGIHSCTIVSDVKDVGSESLRRQLETDDNVCLDQASCDASVLAFGPTVDVDRFDTAVQKELARRQLDYEDKICSGQAHCDADVDECSNADVDDMNISDTNNASQPSPQYPPWLPMLWEKHAATGVCARKTLYDTQTERLKSALEIASKSKVTIASPHEALVKGGASRRGGG